MISTHALREEGDLPHLPDDPYRLHISTHALREEGDAFAADHDPHTAISTHALREEGDMTFAQWQNTKRGISTHALREEGDQGIFTFRTPWENFYPRPPRGGRRPTRKTFWRPAS